MSHAARELVDGLQTNPRLRPQLSERFRALREADQRSEEAADLLDELAAAGASNDVCLETLLELLFEHRLARPAIRNVLLDPDDIAEVEQNTLAAVSLKLSTFEGRSRFTTWLHTIAGNEARMLVRTRSRQRDTPMAEQAIPQAPFLARLSTLLGDRDLVSRVLAELPADQREILTMREVDGLEYQEISDRLDIPVGTVRSRLSRAREAMASRVRSALAD